MNADKPLEHPAVALGHFAERVTNMPPTEIVCACGARFVGGDVIAKQKDHMDEVASRERR